MTQLITIAVTTAQNNEIKKHARAYAKENKKPLSTYFRELKQKLPKRECGGKQHYLIKTTNAIRKKAVHHKSGVSVKVRGKMVPCYVPEVHVAASKRRLVEVLTIHPEDLLDFYENQDDRKTMEHVEAMLRKHKVDALLQAYQGRYGAVPKTTKVRKSAGKVTENDKVV